MKLGGLENLYIDMKNKDIKRYKFIFTFNKVCFDVFFFTDEEPFKLVFGVLAENFYFEIDVKRGYNITAYLGDKLTDLMKILGLQSDEKSHFKTSYFFEAFNKSIPIVANRSNCPEPHDIAKYRRNVEESNKIYFCGWLDNEKRGNNSKKKNLEKTRLILGHDAYQMCKDRNISSRWTDIKENAVKFYLPD